MILTVVFCPIWRNYLRQFCNKTICPTQHDIKIEVIDIIFKCKYEKWKYIGIEITPKVYITVLYFSKQCKYYTFYSVIYNIYIHYTLYITKKNFWKQRGCWGTKLKKNCNKNSDGGYKNFLWNMLILNAYHAMYLR